MIKAAFIGYGRNAENLHAPAIENTEGITVSGVFDIDDAAAERAKQRFDCRVYESYGQALDGDFTLAIILTRNDMHTRMACDFLNNGKHVLVTKPWAVNADEARQLVSTAKAGKKKLLPWLPCRWSSELTALRNAIDSGVIGKPFMVRRSFLTFGKRDDWQTQRKYGGGYLLNWGPHLIDQPIHLIGEPVKTVYGTLKQVINPGDAEDMFYMTCQTASGVTLISEFGIGADVLPDWIVQGDKGTLVLDQGRLVAYAASYPDEVDKTAYRGKVDIIKKTLGEDVSRHAYGDAEAIYAHIVNALSGKCAYCVTLDDVIMLTRILDAVRDSAQSQAVIHI